MKLKPFHPLSQGLLQTLAFNEGGGNIVYDATGHQHHGTGTNIAWGGDGLDLPGVNEHISIPNFIAQDDDWTVFMSFTQDTRNPSAQSDNSKLVAMQDGTAGNGRSILYINDKAAGNFKLGSFIDSSLNSADTVIDVGKAYTAGLTQEGTSFHFYLNGVDDGSFVGTAAAGNGDIILFDHKTVGGNGCFDGTAKVFHWYNRPLSAQEMMWLDYDAFSMFEPDHTPAIIPTAGVIIPIVMNYYNQMARA